jgi:chromosome partitioning protein
LARTGGVAEAAAETLEIPSIVEAEAPVVTDQFRPHDGLSTGPETPAESKSPHSSPGYPQAVDSADGEVSRETEDDVSREIADEEAAEDPAFRVRTAADLAAFGHEFDDMATPLARAAHHSVLARQSAQYRPRLPRPEATRVFVVANQKGGVGKTTSTVNIGSALAQLGQRVLVIDLDPQGNASTALSVEHHRGVVSSYDVLVDGLSLAEAVQSCQEEDGLFVVPATIDLAGAEIELVSVVAREGRLKKAIAADPLIGSAADAGEDRYDYVFIDCPPSLGLLTLNALVAGDEMMIPIQAEYYALEGLGQLLETVELVKADLNPRLAVSTILVTMYDARTRLAAGVADEVRGHFGDQVLRTTIPRSVRVSEAPSYGQTVMAYDPGSPGALSYLEAAREIATKGVTE